ncbi:unnamed protein product [Brachionus calyciflorus]|uniref:Tc1-like transposase DDE domain-containing protein n=1 Tax=Brachionus calyciflorus TaxID=104777 RepID=A0A813Z720_9BILA|nr:unnamed protein product [Brachionus calyciflorus]
MNSELFGAAKYDLEFKLHQDNDPKHNSFLCRSFLNLNNIDWIKSPPKSPDLNPIELVWNELKDFVRKKMIGTGTDASTAIREFEKLMTPEKCMRYINHLKKVRF